MRSVAIFLLLFVVNICWGQTTYQLLVTDDAYVRGGQYADETHGITDSTRTYIRAPFDGNIDFMRYTYWKFDLGEVSGQIDSAHFAFTPYQNVPNSAGSRCMFYFISDDSWNEETITWNNQPTPPDVGTHFYYFRMPTKNTSDPNITWQVDVTDLARQELAGDKLLTIMVRDDSLKDANCRIYSKENEDALAEEKPWLYVYTSPAQTLTKELIASDDAYVRGGQYADEAHGVTDSTRTYIRAPFDGNIDFMRYTYWKFDLSEVNGQINSANFEFTPYQNVPNSAGSRCMFYFISDDSWDEETITWNNQPTLPEVGTHFYFFRMPTKNTSEPNITWRIDVTDLARQELAGDKLLTIMVRDDSLKDANCRIYSKENDDALDEEKPRLVVEYSSTAIEMSEESIHPQSFVLKQNYPNPFNPETTIEFTVPQNTFVEINIFNILGVKVATLVQKHLTADAYKAVWDGKNFAGNAVSSGIYFAQAKMLGSRQIIKMALTK